MPQGTGAWSIPPCCRQPRDTSVEEPLIFSDAVTETPPSCFQAIFQANSQVAPRHNECNFPDVLGWGWELKRNKKRTGNSSQKKYHRQSYHPILPLALIYFGNCTKDKDMCLWMFERVPGSHEHRTFAIHLYSDQTCPCMMLIPSISRSHSVSLGISVFREQPCWKILRENSTANPRR